ncbi:Lrp/AsnC family transcriptional regulator [Falsigemmobacter faecalis]|uniref:Lrp/AsnC family transcriptional regulator n=1 Tax=Falsigemmobacter faecalis TaxID=2488730 RepID=A0A3P3DKN3_9RHOB|nr:Lrp/AsnC family transcriptional regulator [Falsigemmobacter faecalis]RRH74817.1 Lrp/AsnC family transcriptional regulator [Falsigemmobacter faecalis]
MAKSIELDQFDQALLREMQSDNQTPARVLAERVGLSQSAVLRRLRRLRDEGVIVADVSVVNPAVMGVPLTIHVLVSIDQGARQAAAFSKKLQGRSEVIQASYVTGGADFALLLQLESMEAYAQFAAEVFHADPHVSSFYTYVAMREVVGPAHRRSARR